MQIGNGTVLSGVFGNINWGGASHFIKLEADFNGGSNYVVLGTQELMSVPYALYASKTDTSALNLTSRLATKLNATGNVGIGTTTPAYPLDVNGSAKMTTIRDNTNSVGTSGQVLSSTGFALSWISPSVQMASASVPMAIIRETTAANVASAVTYTYFTSTAQSKPRQINSKTEAGLSITLSGSPDWTFTISTAGTYLFEATAMLSVPTGDGQTVFGKLLLNNISLGLGSVIIGDSFRYGPVYNSQLSDSNFPHTMNGIYTITGTTIFRLDHVIISNFFPPTGGKPSNISGFEEVYATLKITKIN